METISELKSHLISYGLNVEIGFEYMQIKPNSPNWSWHMIVKKGAQKKVFQLYRYSGKRDKLIKEFLKFSGESQQQKLFT